MMGSVIIPPSHATEKGSEPVWALLAVLSDPAKSAAVLKKIGEEHADLDRKIQDLDAREQALLKGQKTHAARVAALDSKERASYGSIDLLPS